MRFLPFLAVFVFGTLTSTAAEPRYFVPVVLRPGTVNEVYVWDEDPVAPFRVELRRQGEASAFAGAQGLPVDRPLSILGSGNRPLHWASALVCPEALQGPGPITVRFLGSGGAVLAELPSAIGARSYPSEDLFLDKTMSELRAKPNARKDREAQAIWAIYLRFTRGQGWSGGRFALPVDSGTPISAQFGDIRNYRYADGTSARDYHTGIDFAVPVGTPVKAPAAGKVVLVASRMLTGNTIVLEHGPGIYSVYFHLSLASVKQGQVLKTGDPLGLSGATGLVTGPHLHWEIRVGSVPVDPLDWILDGILDTRAVNAVISSVERPIH